MITMNNSPKPTKLIIFDYDGVLANSFIITCMAYEIIAREFSKESLLENEDAYKELFETDWRISLERMGLKRASERLRAEQIFRSITRRYKECIFFYPKIEEVMKALKLKYNLAIVSNNTEEAIIERLQKFGLNKYVDKIYDISHGKKPETTSILKCLAHFQVAPDEAVMVGDMDGDIIAAKNAGLKKAIAVTYGYHPKHKLHIADVIVEKPEELLKAIG